ncbi:catabolite repressor/activator [Pasteurella sp. PK-2025]|uniref:catabolite repressor/activator n=1 Tax=Pasteurella sp. PK-2025 TaxID=3413133 RepID=UPI003C742D17
MKLEELAKLAGVSRTTASYVVNGKAKQYRVSDKTIEKVEKLIKKYDFKPNAMAAGLRAGKSNTIGLIVPDFENVSYARIANQLESRFREKGYQLLIACSNDNADYEIQCAKHLFQRRIDALIVSTALPSDTDFYQRVADVPVIGFDRQMKTNEAMVLVDDEGDAHRLAQRLIQKHAAHEHILFFGALPNLSMSHAREAGFKKALEGQNKQVDFVYADKFQKSSAAETFEAWLTENKMPDAIFVTSLSLLQGILHVLIQRKGGIPKDLVVATFGYHEMLDFLENNVICCVQNHEKIVESLLNLALDSVQCRNLEQTRDVITRDLIEHRA